MATDPTHYITSNGAAIFVKTAAFFAEQGGHAQEWGRYWRPVTVPPSGDEVRDIEAARALGDAMFPDRGPYIGREKAAALRAGA